MSTMFLARRLPAARDSECHSRLGEKDCFLIAVTLPLRFDVIGVAANLLAVDGSELNRTK